MESVVTAKQYVALALWYTEGWSYRRIGKALRITGPSAFRLVCRGRNSLIRYCVDEQGGNTSPIVEGLFVSSRHSSLTADPRLAASRQDELLDQLELRMEQRVAELDSIEACMSGDSCLLTHIQRNHWDRWEMDLLNRMGRTSLSTCQYEAKRLLGYIADAQA